MKKKTLDAQGLERVGEAFRKAVLDQLDELAKRTRRRTGRKPNPPASPERERHNAAVGFPRTFRTQKGDGEALGKISIRISDDLSRRARERAAALELSLSGWICGLIEKELNKK